MNLFKELAGMRWVSVLVGVVVAFAVFGTVTFTNVNAASLTQAQIDSIVSLLESFGAEEAVIENVQLSLSGQVSTSGFNQLRKELKSTIREFKNRLREGLSNEEVLLLQEILATDSDVYPEGLTTGYFGGLTRSAVIRFQLKYGMEGVGEVGPQTRRALNAFIRNKIKNNEVSENLLDIYDTDEQIDDGVATSTDNGSSIRLGKEKVTVCHLPGGNALKGRTLTIGAPALNAHLSHGDILGQCDGPGDSDDNGNGTTTPDILSPVISEITSIASTTSAIISWKTDEAASSRVVYGTSTPVFVLDQSKYVNNSSLAFDRSIEINTLTASTTFYFLVSSADASGNTATSTENSFTTQ